MNNGPLGGPANRGLRGLGGLHGGGQRTPAVKTDGDPHRSAIQQFAAHAAHRLATAMGATSTKSAIGGLLGHESFSAGVAFGMARNLAVSVYQLGDLLKMFAMAEYDDSQHSGSFWRRIERSMMLGPAGASASITMISLAHFWPGFDRAAKDARDQRDALLQMVACVFEHPGEMLKTISDSQAKKYEEFKACLERHSLIGNFHAGDLFGELLLDVLMVIDGVAAIAKIAAKIPRLLELLPKLNELAPALRDAFRKPGIVKSPYAEGPKPEPIKRGTGQSDSPTPPSTPDSKSKPAEDASQLAFDGQAYLANRREELGLPPANTHAGQKSTLAVLQVNGEIYDGINAGLQDPKSVMTLDKVNPITIKHAEADAVQAAINDGAQGTASTAEMWVDQDPCKACGVNSGLRSLARNLGVDRLIVNSPSGTAIYTPTN